jgi:hypothetical protein
MSKTWPIAADDQYLGISSPTVSWMSLGLKLTEGQCKFLIEQQTRLALVGKEVQSKVIEDILRVCIPAGDIEFCNDITRAVCDRIAANATYDDVLSQMRDRAGDLEHRWEEMSHLNAKVREKYEKRRRLAIPGSALHKKD